ncbi:sensor histidine kinase [Desulfobacca acetoxidans]
MNFSDQKYQQLSLRIEITIIIFCAAPLLLLGFVLYGHFSQQYEAKIRENLRILAENRRGALDLFLGERTSQLFMLGNTSGLKQMTDEAFLGQAFEVMQQRSKSFLDLSIVDLAGNHLAYVGPYRSLLSGINYQNEDWFQAVKQNGEYISDIFLGFRNIPHFIIAVLVRGQATPYIVRATINSDILEEIVRGVQIGKTCDAFIINRDNVLQTRPRLGGEVMQHPSGPDFSQTPAMTVAMKVLNGREHLYAAVPLIHKDWVLVINEDPKEPLAPLLRAKYIVAFLCLGGLLLIIGVAVYAIRKLVQRLMVSERHQAASDALLLQSSKMAALGKMAAGIAHEINNPLAVIAEKAGWLKDLLREQDFDRTSDLEEFQDTVDKIEYHVARAKKITHRLLDFARRHEPLRENVDVNRVLEESIGFLENEAHFRNIQIHRQLDPHLPLVVSDTGQLQQVFLNIFDNAIDAVGKGGEITLTSRYLEKDGKVSITIADSGPGIPEEILKKIFDPFFTTKEVGKGTGLGLSITYSIIKKLGGEITVANKPGQGALFTIILPASEPIETTSGAADQ